MRIERLQSQQTSLSRQDLHRLRSQLSVKLDELGPELVLRLDAFVGAGELGGWDDFSSREERARRMRLEDSMEEGSRTIFGGPTHGVHEPAERAQRRVSFDFITGEGGG